MRALRESLGRYGLGGLLLITVLASTPLIYSVFLREAPTWVKVLLTLVFVALTGAYNYYKDVRPLLDFAARREYFFDLVCAGPLGDLRENFDSTARLNVAEVRWKVPRGRSEFGLIYTQGMDGHVDKDLRLRIDQGACGAALREGRFHVADLTNLAGPMGGGAAAYGLDERQAAQTEGLTAIFSMPIRRVRKMPDGSRDVTDEVIGVVSIDSRRGDALSFYSRSRVESVWEEGEVSLLRELELTLQSVSETCSWIMSS